jgi:hypothetical protein
LERLVTALSRFDSQAPVLAGAVFFGGSMVSGGAGYALSSPALNVLAGPRACADQLAGYLADMEDVLVSQCFMAAFPGTALINVPGMWPHTAFDLLKWMDPPETMLLERLHAPTVSQHHLSLHDMRDMAIPVFPNRTIIQVWVATDVTAHRNRR